MSKEITITVKGEDSTFKQKFLIYDEFYFSENDEIIKQCIKEALSNAKIVPEDIKVRCFMQVK